MDTKINTRLIGICGPAGSGKSTAAYFFVKQGWTHMKMAQPLKGMLAHLLTLVGYTPFDREDMLEGGLKEAHIPNLGTTPRHLMQTLGTEWGRDCHGEDFWVNIAEAHIRNLSAIDRVNIVIDDIRFENEASMIRRLGGSVLHISRSKLPHMGHRDHISEAPLKYGAGDMIINNNSTVGNLYETLGVITGH